MRMIKEAKNCLKHPASAVCVVPLVIHHKGLRPGSSFLYRMFKKMYFPRKFSVFLPFFAIILAAFGGQKEARYWKLTVHLYTFIA